jgi:NAD(P)-dependent dehydrogenase (short-subunit alcohol dehydrogenase family)
LRSFARTWLNELKGRNIRENVLGPGPIATPMQEEVLTKEAKEMFESLIASSSASNQARLAIGRRSGSLGSRGLSPDGQHRAETSV